VGEGRLSSYFTAERANAVAVDAECRWAARHRAVPATSLVWTKAFCGLPLTVRARAGVVIPVLA